MLALALALCLDAAIEPAAPPSLFDTHPVTDERIRRLTDSGG